MPADVEALLLVPTAERTPEQMERLRRQFLTRSPGTGEGAGRRSTKLRKAMPAYPTTLVMHERPPENPRPTLAPQPRRVPPADREGRARRARRSCTPCRRMPRATASASPAGWSSPENPLVGRVTVNRHWAGVLRPGPRPHDARTSASRASRRPPRAARLAGGRVRRAGLVDQEAAPADRDERHLSAVVAGDAGAAGEGRRERAAGPRPAGPAGGGGDPRPGLAGERPARAPRSAARASSRRSRRA